MAWRSINAREIEKERGRERDRREFFFCLSFEGRCKNKLPGVAVLVFSTRGKVTLQAKTPSHWVYVVITSLADDSIKRRQSFRIALCHRCFVLFCFEKLMYTFIFSDSIHLLLILMVSMFYSNPHFLSVKF